MVILMNGIPLATDDNQIRDLDELMLKMRQQLADANETIETHNNARRKQIFEQIVATAQQVISTIRSLN
jgi:hypothetical protein